MSDLIQWLLLVVGILLCGLIVADILTRKDRKLILRTTVVITRTDGSTEYMPFTDVADSDSNYEGTHRIPVQMDETVAGVAINTRVTSA